jgi:hypothetical protein
MLKLILIPSVIVGVTSWGTRRRKHPRLNIAVMIPLAGAFGYAVANNVLVIAKKARKAVRKGEEKSWRKAEGKGTKDGQSQGVP